MVTIIFFISVKGGPEKLMTITNRGPSPVKNNSSVKVNDTKMLFLFSTSFLFSL